MRLFLRITETKNQPAQIVEDKTKISQCILLSEWSVECTSNLRGISVCLSFLSCSSNINFKKASFNKLMPLRRRC